MNIRVLFRGLYEFCSFCHCQSKMSVTCECFYEYLYDEGSIWTMAAEFLLLVLIGICGVTINFRFIKKLHIEKRNTPICRKGNVIEPIMRWFLWFQIIYWPFNVLCMWIITNEIIPSNAINGWWCFVSVQINFGLGRLVIGFNSLFVAFIRYIYIVHDKKANQMVFERLGRWMAIYSFAVPTSLAIIDLFTNDFTEFPYSIMVRFKDCINSSQDASIIYNSDPTKPITVMWTLNYLPENIIHSIYYTCYTIKTVVMSNIIECYLYITMHLKVNR